MRLSVRGHIDNFVNMRILNAAAATAAPFQEDQMSLPPPRAVALAALALTAAPALAEDALQVELLTVAETTQRFEVSLTGTIEASRSYPASFRDGGQVLEVAVDVGDRVGTGALIARVDPIQTQAALRAAEAARNAAEAGLAQSRRDLDRTEALLAQGNATQSDLDSATEDFLTAQATRDQTEADLARARRALEDTTLTAVEAAIVTDRSAEPGQVVGAGQTIVTLASLAGREAVFLVPNISSIDDFLGAAVKITPLEGGPTLQAEVTELSPLVSAQGTVEARVALPDDLASDFTLGVLVSGHIAFDLAPAIEVPWTALTATAEGPAVWLVDPATMRVSLAPVGVQSYSDDAVEVSAGLSPGDLVVGQGARLLYPGREVAAVKEMDQ